MLFKIGKRAAKGLRSAAPFVVEHGKSKGPGLHSEKSLTLEWAQGLSKGKKGK